MKRFFLLLSCLIYTQVWATATHTETIPPLATHVNHEQTTHDGRIDLNFDKAPLLEVVHLMSIYLHHTFLIDPKLTGSLTVISGKPVQPKAAYQLFAQALAIQGFVLVEESGYTAIVAASDAKSMTHTDSTSSPEMTTKLVFIAHLEARTLAELLRALIPTYGSIVPYAANNSLLITDTLPHMHDIIQMITRLDQGRAGISTIPLKYSVLPDIEPFVNKLGDTDNSKTNNQFLTVHIVPDEANNRFFLMGGNVHIQELIAQQIRQLDAAHAGTKSNFHVLYLRNASARNIAQILGDLLANGDKKNDNHSNTVSTSAASTAHSYQNITNQNVTALGSNNNALSGASAGMSSTMSPMTLNHEAEEATTVVIPGAVIEADPAINALVIRSSDAYYKRLLPMIRQLDVRRAQIFIEALVVEINSNHTKDLGIQWQLLGGLTKNGLAPFAGSVYPGSGNLFNVMKNPANAGPGLVAGLVNGTLDIPGIGPVANIAMLGQFLSSSNQANILSTPNLLTLDNQEAEIIVGQNVPFVTGQFTNTNGNTAPFQTIERHDVGLRLHIAPHITENGDIRLSLYQEVSSVMPNTDSKSVDIITNKRAMQTTVRVHDGQIIALGGLIEDRLENQVDKVPILGDLPIFGVLFQHKHQERIKTNLMIFLKPRIIYDAQDASRLSVDRYHLIHALQDEEAEESRNKTHFNQTISPETLGWSLKPLQFPSVHHMDQKTPVVVGLTPVTHSQDMTIITRYTYFNR